MNRPDARFGLALLKRPFLSAAGILCLIFLAVSSSYAEENETYPAPAGYINDYTGILSQKAVHTGASIASQIEALTGAQLAVVIVNTTNPLEIEQYAAGLFEKWSIGQKGSDNGVLLLFAMADRAVRIETGYGMEGAIPDAIASNIIHGIIIPQFRNGLYEKGVLAGILAITDLIAKEYNVNIDLDENMSAIRQQTEERSSPLSSLAYLLLFVLLFGMRSGLLFFFLTT
ncbi:TPM domain-containing protein, partial [bacterium]|nr:TPM domain-containing protein [bacterium]